MQTLVHDERTNTYSLVNDGAPTTSGPVAVELSAELKAELDTLRSRREAPTAELQAGVGGFLNGIAGMQVMGLPVGAAAIGAAGGLVIDRVLGDRLAKWGPLGNVGAAFVVKRFGGKFLGEKAADSIAFVLLYEAMITPISDLLGQVWKGKAAGMSAGMAVQQAEGVLAQSSTRRGIGSYAGAF